MKQLIALLTVCSLILQSAGASCLSSTALAKEDTLRPAATSENAEAIKNDISVDAVQGKQAKFSSADEDNYAHLVTFGVHRRAELIRFIVNTKIEFRPLSASEAAGYIDKFREFLSSQEPPLSITDGLSDYNIENLLDSEGVVYSETKGLKWVCFSDKTQKEDAWFYLILKDEEAIGHGRFMFTPGTLRKMASVMYYITPKDNKRLRKLYGALAQRVILANTYRKAGGQLNTFRIPPMVRYKEAGRPERYEDIIESGTVPFFILNGFRPLPVTRSARQRVLKALSYIAYPSARLGKAKAWLHYYYEVLAEEPLFLSLATVPGPVTVSAFRSRAAFEKISQAA
ncbi:MAG: hypothetical protein ABH843_06615 [Candidatus Omnitrophota bacterium]